MIDVKRMKKDLLFTDPTLYCSAMAHLRGRLHMSKVNGATIYYLFDQSKNCWDYFGYGNKECIADERRHMFHWTMEDQAAYVKDTLEYYTVNESADEEEDEEVFQVSSVSEPQKEPGRVSLMTRIFNYFNK